MANVILRRKLDKISAFYKELQKLNELAIREDPQSINLLSEIDKSYGVSLWGLELRIALLQLIYGIERTKRICSKNVGK